MPDARRDDLTEQVAAPEHPADVAYLLAVVAKLTRERDALLATKAERWLPLKVAAIDAAVEYETARTWAARDLIKARKDGGRVFVELGRLISRRMLVARKEIAD